MSKDTPIAGKPTPRGRDRRGGARRLGEVKLPETRLAIAVHDVLEMDGRVWSVTGVFPGALHQESVIGLRVEGLRHDAVAYGKVVPELFVPEVIIRSGLKSGTIVHHSAAVGFEAPARGVSRNPVPADRRAPLVLPGTGLGGRRTYEDLQHLEIQRAVDYCRARHVPEPRPTGPLRLMGDTSRLAATIILTGTALAGLAVLVSNWF